MNVDIPFTAFNLTEGRLVQVDPVFLEGDCHIDLPHILSQTGILSRSLTIQDSHTLRT